MFAIVKRFRPLIYVLAAAQLLLSGPVVSALSAANASAESDCADMMMGPDADHCPCCPEGVTTMGECLSACTAAFAAVGTPAIFVSTLSSFPASTPAFAPLVMLADPPIKPPPIV